MPRGIASQRIAKGRVAGRPVANRYGLENLQTPYLFVTEGAATFTAPTSGYWKFHAWGPGGSSSSAQASGAYLEITRYLAKGQQASLNVGAPGSSDTTLTFPDGWVATAGRGTSSVGTATNGDFMLSGSLPGNGTGMAGTAGQGSGGGAGGAGSSGSFDGGGGSPGVAPFYGGRGGQGNQYCNGLSPGGGCGSSIQLPSGRGGSGMIIGYLLRE